MAEHNSTHRGASVPLQATARAIELLLNEDELSTAIQQSLALIGRVADQDRAYLFEVHHDGADGRLLISQRFEWAREGVPSEMDNPDLTDMDFETALPRWYRVLREGNFISGLVSTFPEEERRVLEPQGIRSLLVAPIFDRAVFRGFIGFDNCRGEYTWTEEDRALLKSIASAIGIAMGHRQGIAGLEASESRFRKLLDNIPAVAMLGYSVDGTLQYWNHAAESLYGYSREEALGRNYFDLLPPKEVGAHLREVALRLAEGEEVPAEEMTLRSKSGGQVTVLANRTRVEQPGKPDEFFSLHVDLTEHKKLEHQLLRSQRMEAVGSLAGGIAHDLNNLLSPMLMSVGLLKTREDDPMRNEVLDTMESSIQRASDMIHQVLSFERGVEGKKVDIDPSAVLKDLKNILSETLPRNIELDVQCHGDTPHLLGDPTQIHQVLMNLAVNARDAMPEGGRLGIRVETCDLDATPEGWLGATPLPGEYLRVVLEDTGTGISQETLLRIFEPFFTTKGKKKGTGLGLATSLAILKSHRGGITVDSELGKGTRFTSYLPVSREARREEIPQAKREVRQGNEELILVVDDEQAIRQITGDILSSFNYRVETAEHGRDAVEFFEAHHDELSLVITDLMMPVMDGTAAMRRMREIDPTVPILATSGLSSNVAKPDQPPEDSDMFIPKPYRTNDLLNCIQALIPRDQDS